MVDPFVVIGGGLAGGAVATRLARAGHAVTVLERESGPHEKVCGEFLSVEACQDLERLGLPPESLGALPIDRVRVHRGTRSIEARLPFLARSLGRGTLDAALLDVASAAGAEVVRGVRVNGIEGDRVLASDGERRAGEILLATGKHDLRGFARTAPATRDGYVGLKMLWRLPQAARTGLDGAVELILFDQGYAGLQRVADRDANLCLVIKRSRFAEFGGSWDPLIATLLEEPALGRRLGQAEPLMHKPLAIANLPYGYVYRPPTIAADAIWRLGDQAAMTASLSGDGMAGALRSAHLAADCIASGTGVVRFQALLAEQVGRQVRRAMMIQRLAERRSAVQLGMIAGRIWPGLLTHGARSTRLPEYAGP